MTDPTKKPEQAAADHPVLGPNLAKAETTKLSPLEETLFQTWLRANGIEDADAPESYYDYRGFYKATNGKMHPPGSVEHFPDTFKQHGHPTFSVESKYSKGPWDGGMWLDNGADGVYLPQIQAAVSHKQLGMEQPQDPMKALGKAESIGADRPPITLGMMPTPPASALARLGMEVKNTIPIPVRALEYVFGKDDPEVLKQVYPPMKPLDPLAKELVKRTMK